MVSWSYLRDRVSCEASLASSANIPYLQIHADHHHTNLDLHWNDSPLATASSTTSVPGTLGKSHLTLLDYSYVVHGSETRPPLSIRRIYVTEPWSNRYSSSSCIPQHVFNVPLAFPAVQLSRRSVNGHFTQVRGSRLCLLELITVACYICVVTASTNVLRL